MTKKIRLIDEQEADIAVANTTDISTGSTIDNALLMKYLEAIDWKLWEILKIAKKVAGDQ